MLARQFFFAIFDLGFSFMWYSFEIRLKRRLRRASSLAATRRHDLFIGRPLAGSGRKPACSASLLPAGLFCSSVFVIVLSILAFYSDVIVVD